MKLIPRLITSKINHLLTIFFENDSSSDGKEVGKTSIKFIVAILTNGLSGSKNYTSRFKIIKNKEK